MLVAQAEQQFELWTGQAPPAGLFQQAAGQMPL
jgi:shikimate 5-dehydrogenase